MIQKVRQLMMEWDWMMRLRNALPGCRKHDVFPHSPGGMTDVAVVHFSVLVDDPGGVGHFKYAGVPVYECRESVVLTKGDLEMPHGHLKVAMEDRIDAALARLKVKVHGQGPAGGQAAAEPRAGGDAQRDGGDGAGHADRQGAGGAVGQEAG